MVLYRLFLILTAPFVLALMLWRCSSGALCRADRAERFGGARQRHTPQAQTYWLHGASNGELTSARWLIEELLARTPNLHFIITANSVTGRDMVRAWGLGRVTASLAPLDYRWTTARFLANWRPRALIIVENELWPNRIAACASRGIPVVVIGARISARSARRWRCLPGLARTMLGRITALSAQDTASQVRFEFLGLPRDRIGPRATLKAGIEVRRAPKPPFASPALRARTLLAASTHAGEDGMILDAFAAARAAGTFDFLILAPRHPKRGPEIARLIADRKLAFATRSAGQIPGAETVVYLADSLGEMPHWYFMAGACFIGGTLVPKGGHTPWEPAAHGCALLHGPHTLNFTEIFRALDTTGAALPIPDGPALAEALTHLTPTCQIRLVAAASRVLAETSERGQIYALLARAIPAATA